MSNKLNHLLNGYDYETNTPLIQSVSIFVYTGHCKLDSINGLFGIEYNNAYNMVLRGYSGGMMAYDHILCAELNQLK